MRWEGVPFWMEYLDNDPKPDTYGFTVSALLENGDVQVKRITVEDE
jgi:hypothetical protein